MVLSLIAALSICSPRLTLPASGGSASPLTTKGDVYTYSTTNDRLPAAANGLCLQTDNSQTTGLKWGSCGGGAAFQSGTLTVTFGNGGLSTYDSAASVVTAAWTGASSAVTLTPNCVATVGGNTAENCTVSAIVCGVTAISAGVSFTVVCYSPITASGSYTISYSGA